MRVRGVPLIEFLFYVSFSVDGIYPIFGYGRKKRFDKTLFARYALGIKPEINFFPDVGNSVAIRVVMIIPERRNPLFDIQPAQRTVVLVENVSADRSAIKAYPRAAVVNVFGTVVVNVFFCAA